MSNVIDLLTRRRIAEAEALPARGECIACFVRRAVGSRGCTGTLVWTEHWKRCCSPRASALIRRLERQGATCDCSLTGVLFTPSPELWEWQEGRALGEPVDLPPCRGVRARATQPCGLWSPRSVLEC